MNIKRIALWASLLGLLVAVGCGGSKQNDKTDPTGTGGGGSSDLDVDGPAVAAADAAPAVEVDAGPPAPPVTFVITNSGDEELVFNMDRGWQPNIFSFAGKPPKATSICGPDVELRKCTMFPKHCKAACDAPEADRCPVCPEPEKVKDIRAAEKRESVAPGASLEVSWDAKVFVYDMSSFKLKGKRKRCDCHQSVDAAAGEYTVRVCGLRVTKSAKHRSKLQCVDGTMSVPSDSPIRVELDFPTPAPVKSGKKH